MKNSNEPVIPEKRIPRLRSIQGAYDEIKESDPNTVVTTHSIRVWAKKGIIKSCNVGSKVIINMDSLLEYLKSLS